MVDTAQQREIFLLYVEDEKDSREMVSQTLAVKYPVVTITTAGNGAQGLELFQGRQFDIVVTDISMPVMDGIRMAREIKALNPDTAIIAMTAYSDTTYLLNAIEIGISHYILKPIDYAKLFKVIEQTIREVDLKKQVKEQNLRIRKLSRALEQSPTTVMITDTSGSIEYVNAKFSEISGYSREDVQGRNPRFLKTGATPPEVYQQLWNTITSGNEWHGEFLNRKKNGDLFWEMASISPLLDETGTISHYIAVKEDITERKRAEEQIELLNTNLSAKASELEETNRELEAFSYSVSHDLCKPLTIINGYCQVVLELCSDTMNDQCRSYVREIYDGTLRMSQLIDALLNFSRLKTSELTREEVDLSNLAREITAQLAMAEPERRVRVEIADGVKVHGDAKLLRVVLENLLGNAWKYTGKKENAFIEFGTVPTEGVTACFVRDNGLGFTLTDADRLFLPFQRLPGSAEYKGHGIGLATVHRIIQRHGGTVWAEGEPGEGATFYFTVPS